MKVFYFAMIFAISFPTSARSSAKVLKVDGELSIVKDTKREVISEGMNIQTGEKICTGENSYALILLSDESEMELKESTCITLEHAEERPAISLFFGRIINRVSKIFGMVDRYEVHTLTAVAGVRGTVFSANAGEDGTVVFEVDEGEVEIGTDSGETYSIKEDEAVEVSEEGKILKRKPFSSDEERKEWLAKKKLSDEKLGEFFKKLQNNRETIKERLKVSLDNLKKYIEEFENISKEGGDLEEISLAIERERRAIRRDLALLNVNLHLSFRIGEKLSKKGVRVPQEIPPDILHHLKENLKEIVQDKIDTLGKARRIVKVSMAKKIWNSLPDEMKERIKKNYRRWKELPPEKRALIIENWRRFRSMPPERRREIIKNYKRFRELPEMEKRRIIEGYKKWKNLPPEKKKKIIEKYKKFKNLPPEKRKEILKKFRRQRDR